VIGIKFILGQRLKKGKKFLWGSHFFVLCFGGWSPVWWSGERDLATVVSCIFD
jgi:hypothetical protein